MLNVVNKPVDYPDNKDLHTHVQQSLLYRTVRDVKFGLLNNKLRAPRRLGAVHQLSEFITFAHSTGLTERPSFNHRKDLYRYIHDNAIGTEAIDYLEFGVFKGASMRQWIEINEKPDSRFIGFDSFEGLPEDWEGTYEKGYFSTGGQPPKIDDPRVGWVKGYFQDSLRNFLATFDRRNRLVLHMDADLYSSTLYVLATLDERIAPGTVIIFDEFGNVNDEFRAWIDYTSAFRRQGKPIAWADGFYGVAAFEVTS